jgi:hypothetical protein
MNDMVSIRKIRCCELLSAQAAAVGRFGWEEPEFSEAETGFSS